VTRKTDDARGGFLSRAAAGMTSVAGIATAIATITTSASAVLGVVVNHQATQLHRVNTQASRQAQTIQQLQDQVHASSSAPSAGRTPAVGDAARYLSNLTPTVDDAIVQQGQQVIAAQPYANSISFGCDGPQGNGQPDEAYDVAGSSTFTAEVGIADNTQSVTSVIATVTFSNESGQQLGKPVQVSLGHPVPVTLNITGVTQLGMTCVGLEAHTNQVANGFDVVMGNAGVS
jgi:hypothetical protein